MPVHCGHINKREQMVGEGRLTIDVEHWNRINSDSEPSQVRGDLSGFRN